MRLLDKLWNIFMLKRKKVKYPDSLNIVGTIMIHGKKGAIRFGEDTYIISKATTNPTSGFDHCYFRADKDGFIKIGNNVGISHSNITAYCGITIEDNVLIGSGVKIWDTDFHSTDYIERIEYDRGEKAKPIFIKEGAFVGACSIILKGVTIGRHSVVGAGSVVTKSIPDGEVWAGNPAEFIKRLE